jgi:hypothetical protein
MIYHTLHLEYPTHKYLYQSHAQTYPLYKRLYPKKGTLDPALFLEVTICLQITALCYTNRRNNLGGYLFGKVIRTL